jgi:hypothetical protein
MLLQVLSYFPASRNIEKRPTVPLPISKSDSIQQMAKSLSTSQQTPPTRRTTTPSPAPTTATAIESLKADIIKELAPQLIGALKEIIGASFQSAVSDAISQKLSPPQQL